MTVSRPTQGGSPGTWGTQLDAYMDQFVDSTGALVPAAVRTALGGSIASVLEFPVKAQGALQDGATDDSAAISAAFAAAAAVGGQMSYYAVPAWASAITVPDEAGIKGPEASKNAKNYLKRTAAAAELIVGGTGAGSGTRGPQIGDVTVDTNGQNGSAVKFGRRAQGRVGPLCLKNSVPNVGDASPALLVQESQNMEWDLVDIEDMSGPAVAWDLGTGGHLINVLEANNCGSAGTFQVVVEETAPAGAGVYPVPSKFTINQSVLERPAPGCLGNLLHSAGSDVCLVNHESANASGLNPFTHIKMTSDGTNASQRLIVANGKFDDTLTGGTVFYVGSGCTLVLIGNITVVAAKFLFYLQDATSQVIVLGHVNAPNLSKILDPTSGGTIDSCVRTLADFPVQVTRTATGDTVLIGQIANQNAVASTATVTGTTTVTIVSGTPLSAANVGGSIRVPGAGAAGTTLVTTIATVNTGANTCTLAAAATIDVTNANITFAEAGARFRILGDGSIQFGNGADFNFAVARLPSTGSWATTGNLAIGGPIGASFGGGSKGVFAMGNAVAPTSNPAGTAQGAIGGFLYVDSADNKLKFRGASGTITVLALP